MQQQEMTHFRPAVRKAGLGCILIMVVLGMTSTGAYAQWSQFGGPNRNFMVDAKGLADKWPENGPRRIWERDLGDGYSTILVDGGVLYTMYRTGDDEFTIALSAKTGKTIWEHKQASPFTDLMKQFGPGPHSTPVVAGQNLYAIGTNAVMHCFDKKTGKVIWKHDLAEEFGAPIPGRGYGCSAIPYQNTIIVGVDRKRDDEGDGDDEKAEPKSPAAEGQSLMAFDLASGSVIWKAQDYPTTYASPILIDFAGSEQLVFLMRKEMMGVNPANGDLLWHHPFKQEGANLTTPLFNGKDTIFCSSAYDSGSRAVKLTQKDGKTVPEELWYSRRMRMHHGNAIHIGDYVYGSSGDFGPAFFMGMNINTGKIAWRERGFTKANCVYADGKVIILDEDGQLGLATVTPKGMIVHSKCTVAERYAWAAPTLVGRTLFVRDRKKIMALDLG